MHIDSSLYRAYLLRGGGIAIANAEEAVSTLPAPNDTLFAQATPENAAAGTEAQRVIDDYTNYLYTMADMYKERGYHPYGYSERITSQVISRNIADNIKYTIESFAVGVHPQDIELLERLKQIPMIDDVDNGNGTGTSVEKNINVYNVFVAYADAQSGEQEKQLAGFKTAYSKLPKAVQDVFLINLKAQHYKGATPEQLKEELERAKERLEYGIKPPITEVLRACQQTNKTTSTVGKVTYPVPTEKAVFNALNHLCDYNTEFTADDKKALDNLLAIGKDQSDEIMANYATKKLKDVDYTDIDSDLNMVKWHMQALTMPAASTDNNNNAGDNNNGNNGNNGNNNTPSGNEGQNGNERPNDNNQNDVVVNEGNNGSDNQGGTSDIGTPDVINAANGTSNGPNVAQSSYTDTSNAAGVADASKTSNGVVSGTGDAGIAAVLAFGLGAVALFGWTRYRRK